MNLELRRREMMQASEDLERQKRKIMTMYTNGKQTITGKRITVNGCVVLNPSEELLEANGWHKVVPQEPTQAQLNEQRVWKLKDLLAQGDYKIIKCAEAQLTGEPMPYDIEALVAERNAMRAEINELEAQM